jgi:Zn-dependent metalloprotease
LAFAKKFNVTGMLRGETTVQSEDLVYGVTLTKNSGSAEFMNAKRPNAKQDAPQYLPTDDEAIKIATKFLKDRDLFPEGAAFSKVYRENAYTIGDNPDQIVLGQIGVWFNRTLNGLEVKGTQLVVYVGGNGDVIGYYANWRDYQPYKEYPIITPQEAFNQLKVKGVGVGMNNKDATVSIDNAYLAYDTTPGAYKEYYLEPVWVFKGNVSIGGKPVMPVEQYIPALNDTSKALILS